MECHKGFVAVAHMFFANEFFSQNDPKTTFPVPVQRGNSLTARPEFEGDQLCILSVSQTLIENKGQQRLDYY